MFQKLYHHLEQISASTRQQQQNLEQISANTRQQQQNLEHAGIWAEKISEQLKELNATVQSLQKQRSNRPMQIASFFLAGLGLITVAILSIYTLRLSAATDAAGQRSSASLAAYGIVNSRCQELMAGAHNLEERTSRLDSMVKQQAHTIVQLKHLNAAAVRTILYLQRNYDQHQIFYRLHY
ncbi:MAG TPA: hypothetical protein VG605_03915 [Puia sp.]|nr:hypothetical protein [Puia sp.]